MYNYITNRMCGQILFLGVVWNAYRAPHDADKMALWLAEENIAPRSSTARQLRERQPPKNTSQLHLHCHGEFYVGPLSSTVLQVTNKQTENWCIIKRCILIKGCRSPYIVFKLTFSYGFMLRIYIYSASCKIQGY